MGKSKSPKGKRPQDWPAEAKLAAVKEADTLPEEDLGAFLRRRGLHRAHLSQWRQQIVAGLDAPRSKKTSAQTRRIRELERELRRKDKALAETAALLVLKKKVQAIWGAEDGDTMPRSGR
jgi:transposase-like protein